MEKINYKKVIHTDYVVPYNKSYKYIKYTIFNPPMFIFNFLRKISKVLTNSDMLIDKLIKKHTKTINKRVKEFNHF